MKVKVEVNVQMCIKYVTLSQIDDVEDLTLIWNAGNRSYPPMLSRNKINEDKCQVLFDYDLGLKGTMSLTGDKEKFQAQNTTFILQSTKSG